MKTFYFKATGKTLTEKQISQADVHEFLMACLDRDNGAIAVDDVRLSVVEEVKV